MPLVTKNDVIGAEGARRHLLRLLDVAGRLQQAVETAGSGAALGQEQRRAVELTHVADPVGFEDRLAARDRQRVEGPDRPLCVFLEIVEEWRIEAFLHAFQNGEVQLQQFLYCVEDAAGNIRIRISGQLFHAAVGHQIEIELRTHPLQDMREPQCGGVGSLLLLERCRDGPQYRRIVPRPQREALVNDDGAEIRIEHDGAERVFEAADEHRLVDEGVERAAQPAPLGAKVRPGGGRRSGDDQGFEIGSARIGAAGRRRHQVRHRFLVILVGVPVAGMLAE